MKPTILDFHKMTGPARGIRRGAFAGAAVVCALWTWMAMAAPERKAPDAVIASFKGGAAVRAAGQKTWTAPKILQSLYAGDELAVEGEGAIALYLFAPGGAGAKRTLTLDPSTASKTKPYRVESGHTESAAGDKLARALGAVSDALVRADKAEMESLSSRAVGRLPILIAPRATKVADACPVFEWTGREEPPVRLKLEQDGAIVAHTQLAPGQKSIQYPSTMPPLQAGKTYIVTIESGDLPADHSYFIYQPLSEEQKAQWAAFEATLPEKGDPSRETLRAAYAIEAGYYETARQILKQALASHPADTAARELLIKVYVLQCNPRLVEMAREELAP